MYVGERAGKRVPHILEKIETGKASSDLYVITLPESGNHILDMRPAMLLRKEEREAPDFLILGIAVGYQEARQIICSMIDDMYRENDAFDWKAYMSKLDPAETNREEG